MISSRVYPSFLFHSYSDPQIWNECARLITNAIIYYNMTLLSKVYAQKAAANDQQAMAIIRGFLRRVEHINLFGTFEFSPRVHSGPRCAGGSLAAIQGDWSKVLQEGRKRR